MDMKQLQITLKQHIELLETLKTKTYCYGDFTFNEVIEVYNNLNVFYFAGNDYSARVELTKKGYKVDVLNEVGMKSGQIEYTCENLSPEEVLEVIETSVAM